MSPKTKFVQAYLNPDLHAWLTHDKNAKEDQINKDISMSAHVGAVLEDYARQHGYVPPAEQAPATRKA